MTTNQSLELLQLPKDVLYKILLNLQPSELNRICQTNSQISNICNNSEFWAFKYHYSFKEPFPKIDPRLIYYEKEYKTLNDIYHRDHLLLYRDVSRLLSSTFPLTDKNQLTQIKNTISGRLSKKIRTCVINLTDEFASDEYDIDQEISKCFNDFSQEFQALIEDRRHRGRHNIAADINLDADVFKEYPIDQYTNPITALSKAVFYILFEYWETNSPLSDQIDDLALLITKLKGEDFDTE